MKTFTITYTVEWELLFAPEYVWIKSGECFNTKTGNRIKQSEKGGSLGYWIGKKFYSLHKLKKDKLLRKPIKLKRTF